MKRINNFLVTALFVGLIIPAFAQVTYEDNDPGANTPLGFLGWNDNTNTILDIRQNNLRRERFRSVAYTTLDGVVYNSASRISYPLQGLNFNPFSMHHLGLSVTTTLRRSWMNVGTTYTDNADIMHVGLYRQPDSTYNANGNVTDAVIAWGDNECLKSLFN